MQNNGPKIRRPAERHSRPPAPPPSASRDIRMRSGGADQYGELSARVGMLAGDPLHDHVIVGIMQSACRTVADLEVADDRVATAFQPVSPTRPENTHTPGPQHLFAGIATSVGVPR